MNGIRLAARRGHQGVPLPQRPRSARGLAFRRKGYHNNKPARDPQLLGYPRTTSSDHMFEPVKSFSLPDTASPGVGLVGAVRQASCP